MKRAWLLLGKVLFWLCWPGLRVYLQTGARTRVVLLDPEGRMLVVKGWLDSQRWQLPGGGLHRGEEPAAGAVRELHEELGLALMASDLRPMGRMKLRGAGFTVDSCVFMARLSSVPQIRRQRLEITAYRWLPATETGRADVDASVKQVIAKMPAVVMTAPVLSPADLVQ